jgi:hypothetical protein
MSSSLDMLPIYVSLPKLFGWVNTWKWSKLNPIPKECQSACCFRSCASQIYLRLTIEVDACFLCCASQTYLGLTIKLDSGLALTI